MRISRIISTSISGRKRWIQQQQQKTDLRIQFFFTYIYIYVLKSESHLNFLIRFIHHIHLRKKKRSMRWGGEVKSGRRRAEIEMKWSGIHGSSSQSEKPWRYARPSKSFNIERGEWRRVDEMNFLFERFALLRFFFIHSMRWRGESGGGHKKNCGKGISTVDSGYLGANNTWRCWEKERKLLSFSQLLFTTPLSVLFRPGRRELKAGKKILKQKITNHDFFLCPFKKSSVSYFHHYITESRS